MSIKIIADSLSDLNEQLCALYEAKIVPIFLHLDGKSYEDNGKLDKRSFLDDMRAAQKITSSCPPPGMYFDAFTEAKESYAVTVSSNLSGSYGSAMTGRELAEAEGAAVHVFDSKSASAGEALVVRKLYDLLKQGVERVNLIGAMESFIKDMKTYFVLENLANLQKNGRLHRITERLVSILGIKLLMGSDGDGNIAFFSYARGEKQVLQKLADTVEQSGKNTEGESAVISHCNNLPLAQKLADAISERYRFREVLVLPTSCASSMYANEGGVVLAF